MTIADNKVISEGAELWREYVRVNGYAFEPKDEGIKFLARMLDLEPRYIRVRITKYLEA